MPRHKEPMKGVAACDKLRGGGKQPLIRGFPNPETGHSKTMSTLILSRGGEPAEVKHLSKRRKRKKILPHLTAFGTEFLIHLIPNSPNKMSNS